MKLNGVLLISKFIKIFIAVFDLFKNLSIKREYFVYEIDKSETKEIENSNILKDINHQNFIEYIYSFESDENFVYITNTCNVIYIYFFVEKN
jgi:hypothetical protein